MNLQLYLIEGDTSTNDMVMTLANGAAGGNEVDLHNLTSLSPCR